MIRWIKSLFEGKQTRTRLDEVSVKRVEEFITSGYSRDVILDYFNIKVGTYYRIKNGTHRYSSKKED